jgi:DNA mismatch repair protein MutS
MSFHSVLRADPGTAIETREAPAYFRDLNLDQIVAALTAGRQDYNLAPFFQTPLQNPREVAYRHAVMRDLRAPERHDAVAGFTDAVRSVRENLIQAGKLYYRYQKEASLLDAIDRYCAAVARLSERLLAAPPQSEGLAGFTEYLADYRNSPAFAELTEGVASVREKLASITYTLLIGGSVITVADYDDEPDYQAEIERDFSKFQQGAAEDFTFKFADFVQMNHIEAAVLDRVAKLHEDIFAEFDAFAVAHEDFVDPMIAAFDREVQFYMAYIGHMRSLESAGLTFCYPAVSESDKTERVIGGYDLALAKALVEHKAPVITNDFNLDGRERILIVSGPNQGGKTTFARMFGQLHYLASLGCPTPASEAKLLLFDGLHTHFERGEDIHNLRGKLRDDLYRMHETLKQVTPRSLVILNEVFSSTSVSDAIFLSSQVLATIIKRDALCVCVTFIDELAELSDTTVSMASQVRPGNMAERTFKVVRQPPNGLAYAMSIADKYRLTYEQLRERLAS